MVLKPAVIHKKTSDTREQAIFIYHLPSKDKSKRVRFVYAMKGRDGEEGIVKSYKGEFIAPACFMVPWDKSDAIKEVFGSWGVGYRMMRVRVIEIFKALTKNRK